MIYLLQDCYKDSNGIYHDILKIGYSDKSFKESRELAYNTHNFGYHLLFERPGDKELEKYLHNYFKKYQVSTEWFIYDEKIINEFLDISPDEEVIESPIVNYLKTAHRRDIIDPDFLLGTDNSIEERISRSLKIAIETWIYLSNLEEPMSFEKTLEERIKTTEHLINSVNSQKDEEHRQVLLEKYKRCPSEEDYVYVSGDERVGFDLVYDKGKYEIQKLAFEIFKSETYENNKNSR
jgi:hypothetical protein